MNILVTGANGQLGNEMRIIAKGSKDNYIFTDVVDASEESVAMLRKLAGEVVKTNTDHLDITNLDAIREIVKREKVEAIVNCAAYTNVDAAEDNYDLAELLNSKAVENLAIVMREVGGLLVHISTDYVFGGELWNTPYREDHKPSPTGVYGLTKLHGEQAIERVGCKHIIIRTAWLYSEYGKNFVKTILKLTAERPTLKVVFDQVGTPTYAGDLAEAIITILCHSERSEESLYGIYNFSNEGVCSWYDFAKMIAEYTNHTACDIQPCLSDELLSKAHRPAYSSLDKTKIKAVFRLKVSHWSDSLKKCLSQFKA